MNILVGASKRWLIPFLSYGIIWMIISKGDPASWLVGLPCVVLAVIMTDRLFARSIHNINVGLLPGFIVWFLWHSLRGGMDVAWRALQPGVPLEPGFMRYPLALPRGKARLTMINVVSLLPGTLSADVEGDTLILHALDTTADVIAETRDAEQRVAALYGINEVIAHG